MGLKMIKSVASSLTSKSLPQSNGINPDDLEEEGIRSLEAEASLDYLCNLFPVFCILLMCIPFSV